MKKKYEPIKLDVDYFYILRNKKPVPISSIDEWGRMLKRKDRRVAKTIIEGGKEEIKISTVFLGLNENYSGHGKPVLFETMVFGGDLDGDMYRYTSWTAAEKGHRKMIKRVTDTIVPKYIPRVQYRKYLIERKKKRR